MKTSILCPILATLLTMIAISLITIRFTTPLIVEFDINDTISTFEYNIAQTELTEEKREKEIKRFTDTLDKVVDEYAAKNRVVVLVSPAVVSGAKDATVDIQQALLAALKAQNDNKHTEAKK